jgi:ribosomal protein S18 acetylase RimI-like enzyme
MASAIQVSPAKPEDLSEVVRVHQAAFPQFFLSALGPAFLRKYYAQVLRFEGGICLKCERERVLVGFVAGFVNPRAFYRGLRRRLLSFAWSAIPALARDPLLVSRAISAFRRTHPPLVTACDAIAVEAELASLAVRPDAGGRGMGSALVLGFLDAAAAAGATCVRLTTDALDNAKVNTFYQRLGFEVVRSFSPHPGRALNEYRREISPDSQAVAGGGNGASRGRFETT